MGLLAEIRETRRKREAADRKAGKAQQRVEYLRDEAEASERDIKRWKRKRREIRAELEAEIEADKHGEGERSEEWEARKEARLDELADLVEAEEARLDRLMERLDDRKDEREKWAKLRRRQSKRLRRLRKRRQEILENRGRLSEHFWLAEFHCRDGTRVPEAAVPALKALCRNVLEPLRARHGSVHVTSGFRTPAYNAAIGGAMNSIHCYNLHPNATAADKVCDRGGPRDWFNTTAGKADGRGLYPTFTHDDNRNRIGWPDAVWSG